MFGSYIGILIMSISAPATSQSESLNYALGIVFTLVGSICMSYIAVASNKMKGVNFLVITFYLSLLTMIVCILLICVEYLVGGRTPFHGVTVVTTLKMLAASAANFFAVNMFTQANQLGLPATVALLSYVQILYNYLADTIYFNLSFTMMQYVGMLVTLSFMLLIALKKLMDERKKL